MALLEYSNNNRKEDGEYNANKYITYKIIEL